MKEFQRLHPDVDIKVMTGPADRLVRRLARARWTWGCSAPLTEPDLIAQPVMREDLLLVSYPGRPLTQKKKIETSDLNKLPFILYEPGSNTRRVIDEFFVREQVSPRIVMETKNVEIIKAMASERHRRDNHLESRNHGRSEGRDAGLAPHQQPLAGARTGWVYMKADRVPRKISEMIRVSTSCCRNWVSRARQKIDDWVIHSI